MRVKLSEIIAMVNSDGLVCFIWNFFERDVFSRHRREYLIYKFDVAALILSLLEWLFLYNLCFMKNIAYSSYVVWFCLVLSSTAFNQSIKDKTIGPITFLQKKIKYIHF
jgi:hypothetical protein